jgi:hypothetical protein
MLCEFAHTFPDRLADILDRDKGLKRNFREETATDLLMAGMVGLQEFGVTVELPKESVTGADMDWIYAAPHDIGGGTYLRLMIQAKRAKLAKLKNSEYWYYEHLDYGTPLGQQAQTLVAHSASSPDGMSTLPLYFFYHPRSAVMSRLPPQPNVEGINIVFAERIAPVVKGGCAKRQKRLDTWRGDFFSLSELLCWPVAPSTAPPGPPNPERTEFLVNGAFAGAQTVQPLWHPDFVSDRLNALRRSKAIRDDETEPPKPIRVAPTSEIPDELRRSIGGESTAKDREGLERPRVILRTPMTRTSPSYELDREALRSRPVRQG